MAQLNPTTLAAYLKTRFDKTAVQNGVTKKTSKLLKDLKRDTTGGGDVRVAMADVTDLVSFSGDFATAQTGADNVSNQGAKFTIDWFEAHGVAHLSSKVINQTKNSALAWGKAVDLAMKKGFAGMAHGMSIVAVGQGWGEIGQITTVTTGAGGSFVPKVASQIQRYAIGMLLHFSLSLNTNGLRTATVARVTNVEYAPGQELVTVDTLNAGVQANDFCFIAGCRQDSATPVRLMPAGLDAFLPKRPVSDATISTLYGAVRTSRLYGQYVDGTQGGSPLNFLIDAGQSAGSFGNAESLNAYCSPNTWSTISKDLQTATRYIDGARQKDAGSGELYVIADGLRFKVQSDKYLDDTVIFGFDPKMVDVTSIGEAPHLDDEDGLPFTRQGSASGYEIRMIAHYNHFVADPAACFRVQLA